VSADHPTAAPRTEAPTAEPVEAPFYEIRVGGHLGARWAAWFDGLRLTNEDDGTSVICGPVVDQAALHGLLQKLRDLGLTLLSLTRLAPEEAAEQLDPDHDRPNPTAPGANP
jgi:hypothetical protein